MYRLGGVACAVLLLLCVPRARAQNSWEYGGFAQGAGHLYAGRPNAPDARASASTRFNLWTRGALGPRASWRTTWDFHLDTHRDVDRERWLDLSQRGLRQPGGALSELYLDLRFSAVDLRVGKQEIRWGRADGFNPTDNLVPYDYLDTFADERIPVPAVKLDVYVDRARFEGVWIPFHTPSRLPLLGQRWFPRLPRTAEIPPAPGTDPAAFALRYREGTKAFPARTLGNGQYALRWNQVLRRAEFSLSYFDGFDDLPFFRAGVVPDPAATPAQPRLLVSLNREYHRVRVAGADFASQLGPFGIRGEAAYFNRTDPDNRDHLLFVVGIDRAWGDWFVILQYAGQKLTRQLGEDAVFPDLGLRSTLLCRIERTLSPSRSIEVKGAVRLRDGDFLIQPVYEVALSNQWRLELGATIFGGPRDGYLGQFRESSHLNLQLRYSF